jgi:hypothetical protein
MKNYQKGFVTPLVIALVVIVLVGGAYLYMQSTRVCPSWGCGASPIKVADQLYSNSEFSIQYPDGWKVVESPDTNSVIFQAPSSTSTAVNQFQILVVPTDMSKKTQNASGRIAGYEQVLGNKLEKNMISVDGQSATLLSLSDDTVPIHTMQIIFDKGNYTYDISESGSTYYNSIEFTQFYQSFHAN